MQKKYSLKLFKTSMQFSDGSIVLLFFYLKKRYFLIELNIKFNVLWKNNKSISFRNISISKLKLHK